VAEIEVDEVLRLCDSRVSRVGSRALLSLRVSLPWVTNEPKFLPTMQCHVAPLRSSNWSCG
jgi:hypothetical protein